jgi:hypothetical protein
MTVEVRISSVLTPDGRSFRSERRDVRVGRTDCTDLLTTGNSRTPTWAQVVINSVCAGNEPPSPKFIPVNCRMTSGFAPIRRGFAIAAETFP